MALQKIHIHEEEMTFKRKTTSIEIDTDYSQSYRSLYQCYLKPLTCGERSFFLWLQSKAMDGANLPATGCLIKDYQIEEGNSAAAFHKNISRLKRAKVIINLSKGSYRFNPALVWKGSKGDRISAVTNLIAGGNMTRDDIKTLAMPAG